jgi:putative transposase
MQRIPPSEQIRKQLDDLLDHGLAGQEKPIGTLVQLGARLVLQELLERETTERLGRAHYEHRQPGEPLRGYRNGHELGRLRTAEGDMPVQVPQVRDWIGKEPYRSDLMAFLPGNS